MDESKNNITRRSFLACLGSGSAALAATTVGIGALATKATAAEKSEDLLKAGNSKISADFKPIQPVGEDKLVLPKGYSYEVIAAYGDRINRQGDTFGYNAGFPCYFPINGSVAKGAVWVNHESGRPEGKKQSGQYSPEQVKKLLSNQGGSILGVSRDKNGAWRIDTEAAFARRITGLDRFELTGPVRGAKAVGGASIVQGTLANGSGGKTLWDTVLSGEKHFEDSCRDAGLDATHYGWVAEIDPMDAGFKLRKHSSLGRRHHGNAAMGLSKNGLVVVYSADNISDGCIYKFVSKGKYDSKRGKANSDLLSEGMLYAADLENGEWIPLLIDKVKDRLNNYQFKLPEALKQTREVLQGKFNEAADIYVYSHEAALILGATPTESPADILINPSDNSLYITHNGNHSKDNLHGYITRFIEKDNDLGAVRFEFELLTAGGRQSGFSTPNNLAFDSRGNLWITTAVPSEKVGKGAWAQFKNNGIYLTGNTYPLAGKALQFASAPIEAEFSGLCFTGDERSLFLTVQHPGEQTQEGAKPTSMWPHRLGDNGPRPALVAVTGM